MSRKLLSILLIVSILFAMLPIQAMADETDAQFDAELEIIDTEPYDTSIEDTELLEYTDDALEASPGSDIEEDTELQTVADAVYDFQEEEISEEADIEEELGEEYIEDNTVSEEAPEITGMMKASAPMMMAATATSVPYIDANGAGQTAATATEVTASDTEWSNGWYVVTGDVTISNRVKVIGDVHLILSDNCNLSITASATSAAGINVTGSNSLTIYAQSNGSEMGSLTATGGKSSIFGGSAGIGGNMINTYGSNGEDCGTVTICGGKVTATGGGAGIGGGSGYLHTNGIGGDGGSGGTVTIYGGTIYATGGESGGAGIGGGGGGNGGNFYNRGGAGGDGATLTIYGGTVFANGGTSGGAGIGGGSGGAGSNNNSTSQNYKNDGIGGSGGSVTINGGTVIAVGGSGTTTAKRGADIGSGAKRNYSAGTSIVPKNDSNESLYLTTVTLEGAGDGEAVTALYMTGCTYGTNDMRTNSEGKLYMYLPSGIEITGVETDAAQYGGIITTQDVYTAGTLTDKPVVRSVTPDTNTLTITFSEPMNTGAGGVVTISGGAVATPAASPWSDGNTKVTYNLSGLVSGETHTLTISGFQDAAGNEMDADSTHSFTAAILTYPLTVNLNGGIGGTVSGDYAAGASVSIYAGTKANHTFSGWTSIGGGTFADQSSDTTTFIMPANAATIIANWSSNGGGSGSIGGGGSSSGGGGGSSSRDDRDSDRGRGSKANTSSGSSVITITSPAPDSPNAPTQGEIKVKGNADENGNTTVNITAQNVTELINKAAEAAQKSGNAQNGVTVILNVETGGKPVSNVTVNLPKAVQDTIIARRIVNTIVVVDNPNIRISMDLPTVEAINRQAKSDVNVTASRRSSSELAGDARKAIGSRPVFDLKVNYGSGRQVQSFGDGSVWVTIPYTLGENEKAENICAVYVDENGKVHWLTDSVYDSAEKVLRFRTNHFSVYGVGYREELPAFTDIEGHWAKQDIEFIVSRGLFKGTSDTTFSPDMDMTRAMFITVLGRLVDADVSSYRQSSFTDVKNDAYYMGYIEWAAKNDIDNGIGDGKFTPDQPITRERMAVIMQNYASVNGFTLPKLHSENTFADSELISAYAKDAVKLTQMAGIFTGKDGNLFDPQGTATRAEISAVLRRFVELIGSGGTK